MQIAVISDSHYSVDKVRKLLTHLQSIGIDHLIHAGDFIGSGIQQVFEDFPGIKSFIARGNCDYQTDVIEQLRNMEHVMVADVLTFVIDTVSFIVSHIPGMALNTLEQKEADVIIHGHTHVPKIETYKGALVINPGSLMDGDGFMILETKDLSVDRRFRMD